MEVISPIDLQKEAQLTDFKPEVLEKVITMMTLLSKIMSNRFFRERLVLKGGTALNLFYFDVPRLSVDIDLNYIGAVDRATMLKERELLESELVALCRRENLVIKRSATEHAGGKWRLGYQGASNQGGNIEIDIAYMYRAPLWPTTLKSSKKIGSFQIENIPVLDIHELAAGKLSALCARRASRDLFDARSLFEYNGLDYIKLRTAFIVYGAMDRKDWRTVSTEDITFDRAELEGKLFQVLQNGSLSKIQSGQSWADDLVRYCRDAFKKLLPFSEPEREFLERLLGHGEIKPELLTSDPRLQEKIALQPGLVWKAKNVKAYKQILSTGAAIEQ